MQSTTAPASSDTTLPVAIIGAGPAGLTAAYALSKKGIAAVVLEADPHYVGGISRTVRYHGYHFDIGGHRFFSKSQTIEDLWTEILPHDMLVRRRSSKIFYNGKFFAYPLQGLEALVKLGPWEAARCLASYATARLRPHPHPRTFEQWVTNAFGARLYEIFFKTYTEKVWGMACSEISADWAAQRIKGLSLAGAIKRALLPNERPRQRSAVVKTLVDSFRYPRRGPGMLWEACADEIRARGGVVQLGCCVDRLAYDSTRDVWTVGYRRGNATDTLQARAVISSAPLREVAMALEPGLSAASVRAANALAYRDFLTVVLILKDRGRFDDNWIYVHDPRVRVGRIQNFKAWSPEMVPDPRMTCYGLEYFCHEGDGLWGTADSELVELGTRELESIGLAAAVDIVDGCVVRQKKAYPVYDEAYVDNVEQLRTELEERFASFYPVGRNGMHKYNNQDHAMMTALLTAENIAAGRRVRDVWRVNQDAEYHEAGDAGASGLRMVPRRLPNDPPF